MLPLLSILSRRLPAVSGRLDHAGIDLAASYDSDPCAISRTNVSWAFTLIEPISATKAGLSRRMTPFIKRPPSPTLEVRATYSLSSLSSPVRVSEPTSQYQRRGQKVDFVLDAEPDGGPNGAGPVCVVRHAHLSRR
jgi:hypothetical protein